jgi:hypothetical protein
LRRSSWVGHVARTGEKLNSIQAFWGGGWGESLKEIDRWENLGIDGSIILKYIVSKYDERP